MVRRACYWCKRESNAQLMFLKPKGWIRHRTLDETDMLFCSLACFKAFADDEQAATSKRQKKPVEAQEAQLLATLAR